MKASWKTLLAAATLAAVFALGGCEGDTGLLALPVLPDRTVLPVLPVLPELMAPALQSSRWKAAASAMTTALSPLRPISTR